MKLSFLPLILVLALSACSKLTADNYALIKTGMTLNEVSQIIGKPQACNEALGFMSCTWGDENRSIRIQFVADKVVLSSGSNLR